MRTESVTLRHLTAYDKHYTPYYKQYTAHNVVVFHDTATTEKGHQKSRAILYFFPRFSQLITSPQKTVSFADAEFQPGDRMLLSKDTRDSWMIVKITPFLNGSDYVEHYRLECVQ